MKKLFCILILTASAFGNTTVTGNLKNLGTGSVTSSSGAFVRFWLRGCRGNQPRITGAGAIAPQVSGTTFYFDIPADGSGNVSGTLYSTRDAAGTGNGDIECGGSYTAVWYGMQIYSGSIAGPEVPVHAKSGSTLDISNVTPLSTSPTVTSPDGDSTYLRLDAGNGPVTGPLTWSALQTFNDGIDGSGSLGNFTAGAGILANQNTWTKTQTISDITNDAAFTAIGDSITNCYGVVTSSNCYVNRIAAAKGWTLTPKGVNGDGIAEMSHRSYAAPIGNNSVSTLLCCVNDMRNNGSASPGTLSAAQQETWEATVLANLISLGIPDSQKVWGDNHGSAVGAVSYSGTWTPVSQLGNHLYSTTGAGNTATVNIYGSTIYVVSSWQVSNSSTYKITVDGTDVAFTMEDGSGTTLTTSTGAWSSFNGTSFGPYAYRIAGLQKTNHTVVLTCLSADGSNPCYFLMVASNSGATSGTGPFVYLGDTLRFANLGAGTGYGTYGGSDAAVSQHNARLKEAQSELASDGLHVSYVTVDANGGNGYFPNGTNTQSDGVHPSDTGHGLIANAFLAEMSGIVSAKERGAGQILLNVPVCTYLGQFSNGGCAAGATRGDISASATTTSGNIFLGTDGVHVIKRLGNNIQVGGFGIDLLQFGGTTNEYPALKMYGGSPIKIAVRNGDDSADEQLQASTFASTVATGTAPLTVASTTAVTNLNSDQVDGKHANDFTQPSGTPTAGHAACIKSAGPPVTIGYCSDVVSATGACTCN